MTEQEKREKAIEEMTRDIPEKIKVMFSQTDYILLSKYLRKNISMALVKKGYRKEEEVRKETAKEIWQRIYDDRYLSCFDKYYSVNTGKEFGVEVEE